MIPMNYGREEVPAILERSNENVFVSVMIETAESVEAIDDIVAINGLDSICIGLMDLSGSYGMVGQVNHPQIVASMEKVIASAQAAGIPIGCGQGVDVNTIRALVKRGIQRIQTGEIASFWSSSWISSGNKLPVARSDEGRQLPPTVLKFVEFSVVTTPTQTDDISHRRSFEIQLPGMKAIH